jgi:Uma2 family endonuclease
MRSRTWRLDGRRGHSPDDSAEAVQTKVRTYLDKGTQQVWLLYPKTREIHQFIGGENEVLRVYKGSQEIDAEALFPGIEGLTTDTIFALPQWAIKDR